MIKKTTFSTPVRKFFLGVVLLLGLFAMSNKPLYAADNIPFQDTIQTIFTWLIPGYYSNTNFSFGGNHFVGIIFWQTGEQLTIPENISINSGNIGAQAISCSTHLRGIYYNNQRGRRIWPLDTGNLATLITQGYGYTDMTMSGGFYTNCTAVSGGYTPQANEIYGQIDHTIGGQTGFRMIAGVPYNFPLNSISGTEFSHTLSFLTGGIHSGFIFDTNGGIAELSMNQPWCQSFGTPSTTQPIIITGGQKMTFTCNGINASGFILGIYNAVGGASVYSDLQNTSVGHYTRLTGASLATGDYLATCTVLGPQGIVGAQCGEQIPFHVGGTVTPPVQQTGCTPNFQGEITFAPSFGGTVINGGLGTYYTNKTGIMIQLGATEPTHFVVSGDFLETPRSGEYTGTSIFNYRTLAISLRNINTWNNFTNTYSTGTCSYTDAAKRIYVDTIPPTIPVIISPTPAAAICPSTPLVMTRTPSYDSDGAGLAYYKYEIYNNSGATTGLLLSGSTTATSSSINVSLLPLGTYYIKILAVDAVGNISSSATSSFITSAQYCNGTGIVIATPTIWLRNVELNKVYRSDPIIVFGLTGSAMVSISKGMLFINNNTGGNGTTGMITSSDTFYIEMVSSGDYDATVHSTISILGQTGTFSLTTKKNSCNLSAAEKLTISNVYAALKNEYNNNTSKYEEFLTTFQSMIKDEVAFSNNCTLDYLLSLMDEVDQGINTKNHITPNCKEYSIGYDTNQKAYYAPEMMNRYFFINRESLIRHLDYYNPGDCHINSYGNNFWTAEDSTSMKHIAPNGKIYHLVGQYGGFSATELIGAKYFDSLNSIYRYIDARNPAKEIWTHSVDTLFNPIVYAAPNGKEYKIYKTDRGYMSYKLMKVKYYTTLSELKSYIDKNNPSKR